MTYLENLPLSRHWVESFIIHKTLSCPRGLDAMKILNRQQQREQVYSDDRSSKKIGKGKRVFLKKWLDRDHRPARKQNILIEKRYILITCFNFLV